MKSFKADPHVKGHNNDYTALHHAAYNGKGACAKALLLGGAKCSALNKYNETPAQSAHSKKHYGLEKAIIGWLKQHPEGEERVENGKVGIESAVRGLGLAKKRTKKRKEKVTTAEKEETAAGAGAADDAKDGVDDVSKLLKQRQQKRKKRNRTLEKRESEKGDEEGLAKMVCVENREAGQVSSRARGEKEGRNQGDEEDKGEEQSPGTVTDQRMKIVMVMMRTRVHLPRPPSKKIEWNRKSHCES